MPVASPGIDPDPEREGSEKLMESLGSTDGRFQRRGEAILEVDSTKKYFALDTVTGKTVTWTTV